jgi:uncharacterized membrane protein
MSPENHSDVELLVEEGINAARAGDHTRARELLNQAVRLDAGNVRGWLWLSGEVESVQEKAQCLERVLALDPDNQLALQGLAWLREEARRRPEPTAATVTTQETAPVSRTEVVPEKRPRRTPGDEFLAIAALGLVLLALIALDVEGLPAPLPLLRLLLGLAYVLFVPGYALQAALFPSGGSGEKTSAGGLDGPERLALSFGLSVAVIPPLALVLDRLPWGIRLWPIVVGESVFIVTSSAIALWRRRRLPPSERFAPEIHVHPRHWWAAQDRLSRVLYGVLATALLVSLFSAAAIILLPKPGAQFTEFYVLGPEGLAENYPREAAPGEPLSVTAGIANREGMAVEYRIEVLAGELVIGQAGPLRLEDDEVWEGPIQYALAQPGDDQTVDLLLFRDGGGQPYRSLRLWINVTGPASTEAPVTPTASPTTLPSPTATPVEGVTENPTVAPTVTPASVVVHVVQPGETLSSIGRQYGVAHQAILDANGLEDPNLIAVGQELIIPVPQ